MTSLVYSWFTQWKMVIVHIFLGYLAKLLNHSFFCDAIFNTKFRCFFTKGEVEHLEAPEMFGVFVWYNPLAETMVDVGNETTYLGP